uniref:AB hydrolase-1 domain-containing protein n=1 Tax=Tetradesmus obliquus TaxID=3088 RepID=A0A383VQ48_TETOB|eukprot:jgi/Sobl393_1/11602/SZX67020.1
MPALAAAGHDAYALSLRGQGTSQLCASQQQAAAAAGDAEGVTSQPSSSSSSKPFAHGVPLALNVADIAAFIRSRNFSTPPVLVGHSLGGMFVQEYLHQLHRQQQQQQQQQAVLSSTSAADASTNTSSSSSSSSSDAAFPHLSEPAPRLSGAVLLASACAGTVMSFGQFIADVGLPEFLYQMYIVFSCAHLNDIGTARYCWWQDSMDEQDAVKHFEAVRSSSSVLPYVTKEVGAWKPAAPEAAALQQLPPVLALGGAADRIIRPFQVSAAREYWGADVVLMDGVTHDMLLGPQASAVSEQLLTWLQQVPMASVRAARDSSTGAEAAAVPGQATGGGGSGGGAEQLSVQYMASSRRQP